MPADTTIRNSESDGEVRRNGECRIANGELTKARRHEGTEARRSTPKAKRQRRPKTVGPKTTEATEKTPDAKLDEYRARLAAVADILNNLLGEFDKQNPALWEHRTYLMMVGVIYERLVLYGAELPTDDVVDLAKVLTAYRRTELSRPPASTSPIESDAPLVEQVADAARELYGVTGWTRAPAPPSPCQA